MVWCRRFRLGLIVWVSLTGLSMTVAATPARPAAEKATPTDPRDAEALLARMKKEGRPLWADGDVLTAIYQGKAKSVELCCGLQEPLEPLPGSDVWVLQQTVADLDKAVLSYSFVVNGTYRTFVRPQVWRGPNAPAPPQRTALGALRGEVLETGIMSTFLDEWRPLSVYLPPDTDPQAELPVIYMADGESVAAFAAVLEPLITAGKLSPFVIVGLHSAPNSVSTEAGDLRAQEYLPTFNPKRFEQHEAFVLREVIPWAEANEPVSKKRSERAVFGFSNGGVFAAAMGLRHPDVFGDALAFSLGVEPRYVKRDLSADFYFVAGTLESGFFETTRDLAETLTKEGVRATFNPRVAGHDLVMWEEMLPGAVAWAWGKGNR